MAIVGIIIAATKLAGVLATATVAASALSFSRFRRKNLRPFVNPIDESRDVLAAFNVNGDEARRDGEDEFFFGLATAPAHVEDKLNDAWLQFAEDDESPCEASEPRQPRQIPDAVLASSNQAAAVEPKRMMLKRKKSQRISMEAMIRGYQKYIEVEEPTPKDEHGCHEHSHHVAAWHNVPHPEERLRFWSDPETELKLAKNTGITVFRMGVDWSRIFPKEPTDGLEDTVNFAALERYRWILHRVHSYGMKVMLTLFHHSLPPWAGNYGGWKVEKTVDYFMDFTRLVVDNLSDLVDYWVTFNEPHVFCMLTYTAGAWPGGHPDMLEVATSALPTGVFNQAMHWMAVAHSKAYDYIHEHSALSPPIVGVAHNVSFTRPYGLFDVASVTVGNSLTLYPYLDSICGKMDFIGLNYYGQEVFAGAGLKLVETDEYSESGRGVYPDGLYRLLCQFNERYKDLNIPFIITENGVADETDLIRKPYMLEHLLAIYAAMLMGVRVIGYLFWTISDNWEWADGYGPKFGLVAVDRANDLARTPRPSYHLFSKVATTGKITRQDRQWAWYELRKAVKEKRTRPFYREVNKQGLMYAGGLDEPTWRPYVDRDWRFGHYKMEGLQDPLSRFWGSIRRPFFPRLKITPEDDTEILVASST
ncbi:hypothetical protein Droror1_Dr00001069 [Drosera rotundifolia]